MIAAEALSAVTGLWPKKPPTRKDLLAAQGLLKSWGADISRFVRGEQGPFTWSIPPAFDALHQKITEILTPEESAEWMSTLGEDPQLGLDYAMTIKRGRDYLLSIWPTIPVPGLVIDSYPLSQDDLDAVWSVFRVLDDADVLVSEVSAWSLTAAQAAGFRVVFPELSVMIDKLIDSAMIDMIVAGTIPRWEVANTIKVWRGMPLDKPIQVTTPAEGEKPSVPSMPSIDFKSLRAPSEKGPA